MEIEKIAQVAHEVNRAYCESMGDDSQKPWDEAPEWQKKSAIEGVKFHLENYVDAGPEASHNMWLAHKKANGWTFGPVKDEKKLQHPCMMPFWALPPAQRAKDYLFRAVVHALKGM